MWNTFEQKPEHGGEIILKGIINYRYPGAFNAVFVGSYDKREDVFLDRNRDVINRDTFITGWQHLPEYE